MILHVFAFRSAILFPNPATLSEYEKHMILLAESAKVNESRQMEPRNSGKPSADQLERVFNVLSETVSCSLMLFYYISKCLLLFFSFPSYLFNL